MYLQCLSKVLVVQPAGIKPQCAGLELQDSPFFILALFFHHSSQNTVIFANVTKEVFSVRVSPEYTFNRPRVAKR